MAVKSETFIKLGLVFFISLLSFAIGTLVGKEYSERQYKLSRLEPQDTRQTHADREVASDGHKQNKLSDEEIAKLAEEFVTDDNVQEVKNSAHKEVPPIEGAHTAATSQDSSSDHFDEMNDKALEAAQNLIDKKSQTHNERTVAAVEPEDTHATPEKKIAPQHAMKTKPAAIAHSMPQNAAQENVGKYTVQVGSFLKELDAKKKSEELRGQGYTAFYVPGVLKGKTWYRVNIGTFATQDEAKRANDKFAGDHHGQRGFVKEIAR